MKRGRFAPIVALAVALIASSCTVHIVGDSTAAMVLTAANEQVVMTGSTAPGCGYGDLAGGRRQPSETEGYASCVIDWLLQAPDDVDDMIVAFVSLHDAMCSVDEGCLPFDTAAYVTAHADLVATGHDVAWVEVPPFGDAAMQARIDGLNAAVATALGCTLVDSSIRVDDFFDGVHYASTEAAQRVGARLGWWLGPADVCP